MAVHPSFSPTGAQHKRRRYHGSVASGIVGLTKSREVQATSRGRAPTTMPPLRGMVSPLRTKAGTPLGWTRQRRASNGTRARQAPRGGSHSSALSVIDRPGGRCQRITGDGRCRKAAAVQVSHETRTSLGHLVTEGSRTCPKTGKPQVPGFAPFFSSGLPAHGPLPSPRVLRVLSSSRPPSWRRDGD